MRKGTAKDLSKGVLAFRLLAYRKGVSTFRLLAYRKGVSTVRLLAYRKGVSTFRLLAYRKGVSASRLLAYRKGVSTFRLLAYRKGVSIFRLLAYRTGVSVFSLLRRTRAHHLKTKGWRGGRVGVNRKGGGEAPLSVLNSSVLPKMAANFLEVEGVTRNLLGSLPCLSTRA